MSSASEPEPSAHLQQRCTFFLGASLHHADEVQQAHVLPAQSLSLCKEPGLLPLAGWYLYHPHLRLRIPGPHIILIVLLSTIHLLTALTKLRGFLARPHWEYVNSVKDVGSPYFLSGSPISFCLTYSLYFYLSFSLYVVTWILICFLPGLSSSIRYPA